MFSMCQRCVDVTRVKATVVCCVGHHHIVSSIFCFISEEMTSPLTPRSLQVFSWYQSAQQILAVETSKRTYAYAHHTELL